MKKLKNKNPEAQKKRSSHKVHGVSPEVIAQKGVYGGKDLWKTTIMYAQKNTQEQTTVVP